ncbi:MAG TPA: hypothetical protein VF077_12560 [Nitrospiraceae bacterium]
MFRFFRTLVIIGLLALPAYAGEPTKANFQAVQLGMRYPEVVRLLGPPSYTIYENVGKPLPSAAYAWHINGALPWTGAHIQVSFEHDIVTQKNQNGLR